MLIRMRKCEVNEVPESDSCVLPNANIACVQSLHPDVFLKCFSMLLNKIFAGYERDYEVKCAIRSNKNNENVYLKGSERWLNEAVNKYHQVSGYVATCASSITHERVFLAH